jgi:serine/threonine protein kinase
VRKIGRYEVIRELGRGGMGVVLEAHDPLIRRTVAIKTIHLEGLDDADGAALEEKFLREARAAGALSHPGIVVVHDVGRQDDFAYIAMERVDGPTLRQSLAGKGPMPPSEALQILRQTATALDFAHGQGVIHRDIKPANIMLHHGSIVKVTDFGLAKLASTQHQSRSGVVQGTPSYMAPEQINAQAVDGRTDQFALAVTAYEMLTAHRPFEGEAIGALMNQILNMEPPPVTHFTPGLPNSVNLVLRKALSKVPGDRYATCAEFVASLEKALTNPGAEDESTQTMLLPGNSKPRRRAIPIRWLGIAAAVVLVLVVGAIKLWFTPPARVSPEPPPPPIAIQFDATPRAVEPGQAATLTWSVAGASEIAIDGIGVVAASGSQRVRPARSTVYRLTAAKGDQKTEASVEVISTPPKLLARGGKPVDPEVEAAKTPPPRAPAPEPAASPGPAPLARPPEQSKPAPVTVAAPKLREPPADPRPPASQAVAPTVTEGRIVWTGQLLPGTRLTISGTKPSMGQITGALPEGQADVEVVSPTDLKVVPNSGKELVLENAGGTTITTAIIRWTVRKH